jgi:hypothetical protein
MAELTVPTRHSDLQRMWNFTVKALDDVSNIATNLALRVLTPPRIIRHTAEPSKPVSTVIAE